MKTSDFDYNLPEELIAQTPVEPRDHSRLLVYDREDHSIQHLHFYDLPRFLNAGDVMVINDTRVIPARLLGEKEELDAEVKALYQRNGIAHILSISGVKTQNLAIPLTHINRINSAFVPLHIAKIYILKLCLDEEIIPRCRFPCSRGYFRKYINWQKKQ